MALEQVTGSLAALLSQLGDRLKSLPFKTVYKCLCGLLGLWILVSLLQLLMVIIPASTEDAKDTSVLTNSSVGPLHSVDIVKLQAIPLFGKTGDSSSNPLPTLPVQDDVEINATKTRLNLDLEGIIHTPDSRNSLAVIVFQGKQDQYYVGDKLPVGNRVELAKVLIDHVILDNAGNYESLWLYDDEKINRRQSITGRRVVSKPEPAIEVEDSVIDIREDEDATDLASDYRQRLYKNPGSLAEVLRIAPAQDNGELIGYKVSPGRDSEQFSKLGFENNDIVTSINGITLDEPSKALEVYKLMRTAKEASFTVERDGQPVEVMVSLDENAGAD